MRSRRQNRPSCRRRTPAAFRPGDTLRLGNPSRLIDEATPPLTINPMMHTDLIERLHATPWRGVLAITGGGSGAIERLLTVPGASATVLEAVVPYCQTALADWLDETPARACDERTARQMAMCGFERARRLAPDADPRTLFGVGCTASLASSRPKRGDHRAHIAVQTAGRTLLVTLQFEKGRRSRADEEGATAHTVVATLAQIAGVHQLDLTKTPPGIEASVEDVAAPAEWVELLLGERDVVTLHHAPAPRGVAVCLFPGSFNPPHAGHAAIARHAAERTGRPVVLELSITNVDKAPLDYIELTRRTHALAGQPLWLTQTPTFAQKAELAPGAVFAVGADTIERIGQGRYYADDAARDAALQSLAERGCRFLVFGRMADDQFAGLDHLALPPALRALCDGVPETDFRVDVSSSEIRSS
ncbi:nicotinic acid mononucleotide adenylyltransferase [Botrimarina colliarenosi]|uniref:Nicotinic acid mononucleotide adenylyltransferase n=2 Tax=Botrimarina colliarenosi TaxID=2528001 RepID=A0A5C6ALX0_9BACT|nr:nicotinic acid mononucleotide adenylyltransferase [Botrimarina colliarenosi]